MSNRTKAKPKKIVKEAEDIVINSVEDATAIRYLSEILEDDFPDLDLGRMDLHEALETFDKKNANKNKSKSRKTIENLNNALGEFIDAQESKMNSTKKKSVASKAKKKTAKKKSTKKKAVKK